MSIMEEEADASPAKRSLGVLQRISYGLLGSSKIYESEEHRNNIRDGDAAIRDIEEEIRDCRRLIAIARERRRFELHNSPALLLVTGREGMHSGLTEDANAINSAMKTYSDSIKQATRLKAHLEALEAERNEIKHLAHTQAMADISGYHGLANWAHKTHQKHEALMGALYQVSFVGAGLTYSTIFSATRGNLGFMCYAFALFNCGFIIPLLTLGLLKWASAASRETIFGSPQLWSVVLDLFIYTSVAAVIAAICLLNATIIFLHFPRSADGTIQDSQLGFNIAPLPAGIFALVGAGLTIGVTLFALVVHYSAHGWKRLLKSLRGDHTGGRQTHLRDYINVAN